LEIKLSVWEQYNQRTETGYPLTFFNYHMQPLQNLQLAEGREYLIDVEIKTATDVTNGGGDI
jgi:hypothetical protein